MTEKYFGLYCPQCNVWIRKSDGTLLFYPAAELANAHLNESTYGILRGHHFWAVTEFGKEVPIDPKNMPAGTALCPSVYERKTNERI